MWSFFTFPYFPPSPQIHPYPSLPPSLIQVLRLEIFIFLNLALLGLKTKYFLCLMYLPCQITVGSSLSGNIFKYFLFLKRDLLMSSVSFRLPSNFSFTCITQTSWKKKWLPFLSLFCYFLHSPIHYNLALVLSTVPKLLLPKPSIIY